MTTKARAYLDFEKPVAELEAKISELEALAAGDKAMSIGEEIARLRSKAAKQLHELYANLDAWRKAQVARHADRPHAAEYITGLIEDFVQLAGDRYFGEDAALIAGIGAFRGTPVVVMGLEKGRTTETRILRNFGMAHPEGYRKAVRMLDMADRFKMPVLAFVDTAGAFPGQGAEERGQAEAIARSTERCLTLGTPLLSLIIGEGGSGGAVALASGNKVLMMEHAVYSVISPEGCASILWRDAKRAPDAANAMRITARDLMELRVVDAVVPEPLGGAHRDPATAVRSAGDALQRELNELRDLTPDQLRFQRKERFYRIGRLATV
jgi:acetyl-CoA carboxylase carboxyl transferase subunit alpha